MSLVYFIYIVCIYLFCIPSHGVYSFWTEVTEYIFSISRGRRVETIMSYLSFLMSFTQSYFLLLQAKKMQCEGWEV